MGLERIVISFYLKDQKVVRVNVSKAIVYLLLILPLLFLLFQNYPKMSYLSSRTEKKEEPAPEIIKKVSIKEVSIKEADFVPTEKNNSKDWSESGLAVEALEISMERGLRFFLTKSDLQSNRVMEGKISVEILGKNQEVLKKLEREEYEFQRGRYTSVDLTSVNIDLIKKVKIQVEDGSQHNYHKTISISDI